MFKCEWCTKKFKSKQGLSCHTTTQHKNRRSSIILDDHGAPVQGEAPEKKVNKVLMNVIMQLLEGYEL